MRIDGACEIREAHSRFNRPGRIRVHIGKPVEFPKASDPQEIARDLEQRVAALGTSSNEI
jgi:1-acyl-sn-glycerol-3-phosphate acyltransferase